MQQAEDIISWGHVTSRDPIKLATGLRVPFPCGCLLPRLHLLGRRRKQSIRPLATPVPICYDVQYFKGEDGDKVLLDVTVKTPSVDKNGEVRIYVGGGHWVPLLDLSSRRYDRGGTPGDKFTPIHVLAAAGGSGLVWLMWDNENQRPVAAKVGYMNETSIEDEKNVYDQMVEKLGAKKKYLLKVHGYDRIFKVDRGFETDDHHDWIVTLLGLETGPFG
uniref:Uncharacterized protein n=1 Tax=Eutreptiella gymnastica TaxID=73025 RepID=A0A7S4D2F3_9EUGL